MPLVKQRGFKFSILCDVFLLNIFILLSILINVGYSVPITTKTIINSTTPIQTTTTNNVKISSKIATTAAVAATTVDTTTSLPIITSSSSSSTTSTATTITTIEKFNLSVQLHQNNNYNVTTNNKDNNNNNNDKIKNNNNKNFNSSMMNINMNNNNNNNHNNKELPIQYAELETLKTLSKRFDIYSDFSKIPFDTIHRILRDEEPEYRNDDQRIQRRWKKSTSTEGTINHHQYNHTIEKRSPDAITSTIGSQSSSSSLSLPTLSSNDNHDNNNNNNINNNNLNLNIKINNYDNNLNENLSSDSTKKFLNLENKNLSMNTIIKRLNHIKNFTYIEYINMKNNNIDNFSIINNLNKFINLKYLDLSYNNLIEFHLNNNNITFQLEILNLSGNKVSNLTFELLSSSTSATTINSISNFDKLKELNLSKNHLNSINVINVSMLNHLEIFDLSCNQIHVIDKNYFSGHIKNTLKYLNLSNNKLNIITNETFNNLLNIITLILSNNNIKKIDYETFLRLPNLQYLDLSYNNIGTESIHSLQGIPDLIGLSIAYNPNLGDSLQEFVASWSLKELDISGTGLCKIPAALAQSVRSLKLADNWFEIIRCGDLDSYPLLQYLDLSYSHIDDIEDDALGRLEILETLFLDHNNLYRIPISLPISLENLFLHNNQIMDIQPQTLQTLINLKILDLSGNKIMYLPGLPLPKLLTLNLQSCELRGLSQSVVKTSPKLRDLLLDGNPIKCTDLLGIAEWASPCRNERIIIEPIDIKANIQNLHRNFNHFNHGERKLCNSNDDDDNDDCCGNLKMKELKKPICANVNKTKNKFSHMNGIEIQLQKNITTDDNNDNGNDNDEDDNDNDSSKTVSLNLMRNRFQDIRRMKQQENQQKKDKIIEKFNTVEQTKRINRKSKGKLHNNQSRSLFMTNTTTTTTTTISTSASTSTDSGKDNIITFFSSTNKTAAMPNKHETNIKTSEKLFSDTSTNEQVHKDINNNRYNNKSNLIDAKIPILSLLYNSNESFIDNVNHEEATTTTTTTIVKGKKISKNIQQQQENRATETRVIPNINSDNNYVETSVLYESMRSQHIKQNESHFESENGQQEYEKNSKKPETKNIIKGKKRTSKNIETLPKTNDKGIISSYVINDDNIKDEKKIATTAAAAAAATATAIAVHGNNNSDTNLRTIDDGHTDMSIAIKSNQINQSKFLMPTKMIPTEIKESLLAISEYDQDFPINDQSLSDDFNTELKSTIHTMTLKHKSQPNRNISDGSKQVIIKNNTKEERKVNFPETESNFEENNLQNYKRKTMKDSINTELFSTLPPKDDISKIISFQSPATITTLKPPKFKIYTTTKRNTIPTKQIPLKMPSNQNEADTVVFFDQTLTKKGDDIVSQNQNISHLLGRNYHRMETVKQEAVSTNFHYQSPQKQYQHQNQQQQQQHEQPNRKNLEQYDERLLFENEKRRQHESKTMSEGLIQKHSNSETVFNNTNRSLLQRKGYNLNNSQQDNSNRKISLTDKTTAATTSTTTIYSGNSDKQDAFDKNDTKNNLGTITENIVKETISTTYLSSNKLKTIHQVTSSVTATKLNATKLKRPRNKQSRKYNNKNQKIPAINLENSPLIKDENENLNSETNFLTRNSVKNPIQLPDLEINAMTFSKHAHHHLNTPKEPIIYGSDSSDQILSRIDNHKTDTTNADKLTTHSLFHHTVNTAILPYTVDDYAFERSGNKETSNDMPEKNLPPTSIELVKMYSPSLDILSSYSNDEPNYQKTSNDFDANLKSKYILTTELNRISFTDETERNTFIKDTKSSYPLVIQQNIEINENSSVTINSSNDTSSTTISHNFTAASNKSNNNNNNSVGDGNDNGLPPEQWLDIRKATSHPGLFIVIGITFGMLFTLGVIHIYRCRRPWYHYYNQKGPHTLHNNNFSHFNNHHHQHHNHQHQQQQQHQHNNRRQYNDTSQYSRHHSLTTTASDDYCQCNDEDYYIEADYESSQSSIRRDFLPMELLSLNGNISDICNTNNSKNGHKDNNSKQSRKNSKNTHNLDGIW